MRFTNNYKEKLKKIVAEKKINILYRYNGVFDE